jgi:hypothetical protein
LLNTLLYELINVSIYLILLLGHPFIYNSELSWKRARVGYGKYDSSDVPMKLDDIREDAMNYMERLTLLKIQRDFLNSKGITDHEQFLRDLARHRIPVM